MQEELPVVADAGWDCLDLAHTFRGPTVRPNVCCSEIHGYKHMIRTGLNVRTVAALVAFLTVFVAVIRVDDAARAGDVEKAPPVFAVRTLYAPGHFGNSYEVMGENEMQEILQEALFWGFNRYADWFDMEDCADPFSGKRVYQLGHVLWARKKAHFLSAQRLGLACDLVITPNHVYVDQCRADWLATTNDKIFGQLLCPSIPEARAAILRNYENLFADLAASGVRVSALVAAPYDFGGCACDRCRPWILTFAKLCREIYEIGRKYHPKLAMEIIGWWWQPEEHQLFATWCDEHYPGWVSQMYLHIPYGQTDVASLPLPQGCARSAFVHIGYADQAAPRDVYGHLGPVIAPTRLEKTVHDLARHGCHGVMAYSEGVFDDVNKAILAGLASGRYSSTDEVLRAYAVRCLCATDANTAEWVAWLKLWGRPFEVDAAAAEKDLEKMLPVDRPGNWRVVQWRYKCKLMKDHQEVMRENEWSAERIAAAEHFFAAQEELQRKVWGLGPLRHIFARPFTPLPWYGSWADYQKKHAMGLSEQQ
ncbi:hypothetical protein [Thermogutta sp.]|uniref:hypothetical protein n=2 Tax=Thermogutta sp. TaxID=1962930 RepID=UPI00321F67CD